MTCTTSSLMESSLPWNTGGAFSSRLSVVDLTCAEFLVFSEELVFFLLFSSGGLWPGFLLGDPFTLEPWRGSCRICFWKSLMLSLLFRLEMAAFLGGGILPQLKLVNKFGN